MGAVLCRKVRRKLVESFWVQRNDGNEGWRIERKKERGDGRGEGKGDAVRYGWSCARCGWGGHGCSMEAGALYCRKCEWQCREWCEAAESQTLSSTTDMDRMIQSEPADKCIGSRMMQRMREARERIQKQNEQLQLDGWN